MLKSVAQRLAIKLSISVVVIEILFMTAVGIVYFKRFTAQIDERQADRLQTGTQMVVQGKLNLAALKDQATMSLLLGEALVDAMIITNDGLVAFSLNPDYSRVAVSELPFLNPQDLKFDHPEPLLKRVTITGQPFLVSIAPMRGAIAMDRNISSLLYFRTSVASAEREKAKVALLLVAGFTMTAIATSAMLALVLHQSILRRIRDLARIASQVAEGKINCDQIMIRQQDEIGTLTHAFQEMQAKIAEVVRSVKTAAQDVAQRSREMSIVAEQLSEGASQQASATEEVSASMQEMAANIHQTAENARLTEGMAVASAEDARAGRQAVTEIIQAMEVIADRISVVQEIASQTNMLSLNATIEASKAQDFGKGFSVVASSVRDLARQSRAAADEIRTLVHSCVVLSAQAGEVLQRLVPNSEKTAELVQEINAASQEQSTGVEHVNQAVQQLDTVTQHTAATAEEVAATAESLTTQADALQQAMAFFTVNEVKPVAMPAKTTELLQSLGLDKQQLVALLTTLTAEDAPAPHAARPSRPSEAAAVKPPSVLPLKQASRAADEMDQEFEHF